MYMDVPFRSQPPLHHGLLCAKACAQLAAAPLRLPPERGWQGHMPQSVGIHCGCKGAQHVEQLAQGAVGVGGIGRGDAVGAAERVEFKGQGGNERDHAGNCRTGLHATK